MTPDQELLRKYASTGNETAFAELVRRHVDLVYSAALRLVAGDTHLAEDITQRVFADLARQAKKLSGRVTLGGWLHTSARFAALNAIRGEQRRRTREQEVAMENNATTSEIPWEQLRPLLDEAVGRLRDTEREAIILRYFQSKSLREVGEALGLGENAARKRLDYALEKLQTDFARRGVQTSAVLLAEIIGGNSVQAAPSNLATSVAGASLANQTAATGPGAVLQQTFFMNNPIKTLLTLGALAVLITLVWLYTTTSKATVTVSPAIPQSDVPTIVLKQPQPPVPLPSAPQISSAEPKPPQTEPNSSPPARNGAGTYPGFGPQTPPNPSSVAPAPPAGYLYFASAPPPTPPTGVSLSPADPPPTLTLTAAEQETAILYNLRRIFSASRQYILNNNVPQITFSYLLELNPSAKNTFSSVAGEDYSSIVVTQGDTQISVTTSDGRTITYDAYADVAAALQIAPPAPAAPPSSSRAMVNP